MNFVTKLATATAAFAAVAALAPTEGHAQTKPVVKLCTAGSGGAYEAGGNIFAQQNGKVTIIPVPSEGSADNYIKMKNGECDAAIVQGDADVWNKNYSSAPVATSSIAQLAMETLHLVCGKTVDINKISNLRKDGLTLAVGGGAQITFDNFKYADEGYKETQAEYMTTNDALAAVAGGEKDCALVSMAQGAPTMMSLERNNGDVVQLVKAYDRDVASLKRPDGEYMYQSVEIEGDYYPQITGGWDVDSLGNPSRLVVANDAFIGRENDRKAFVTMVTNSRKAAIAAMTPKVQ